MSIENITLYDLAQRFVGEIHEVDGPDGDHFILWCHESCSGAHVADDAVPWCSAFVNRLAWLLRLPRSKSRMARSWLAVGVAIPLEQAQAGTNDVVVLKRGPGVQPGPDVLNAPGHVTVYGGLDGPDHFFGVGGNQSNGVTVGRYKVADILGVRRLR